MKHIITLFNQRSYTGKTTLALNIASILSDNPKQKTVYFDYSDLLFDSEIYSGSKKDHLYRPGRDISEYLDEKNGFPIVWCGTKSLKPALKELYDRFDIMVLDAKSGADEMIFEISDKVIIPAGMTPLDTRYCQQSIKQITDMKFPSTLAGIIINKNTNSYISAENMQEVFRDSRVHAVLPYVKEIEDLSVKGEIYYQKNKKSQFIKQLQAFIDEILPALTSKPHIKLIDKYEDKAGEQMRHVAAAQDKAVKEENKPSAKTQKTDEISLLKKTIHKELFEEIDIKNLERDALIDPEKKKQMFGSVMSKIKSILDKKDTGITDRAAREELAKDIFNEVVGLGIIEDMLADREISEIMVNRHDEVYVEKKGRLIYYPKKFTDEQTVRRVIERIVMPLGRRIDESQPYVDARLPDGSRVNAIIPPLAIDGSVLTIRKFSDKKLTADDLVRFGSLTEEAAEYLKAAVAGKKNVLISGGTGSGKTTLLNVLSSFIPEDERILTIEDSAELKLNQEHVVRLESRPANIEGRGEITIRDLVKNALRMRPDRIVVGECRGGESLDMLQAMNTGHEGSMTTLHSNSPRDALSRLEVMVLMAGVELPIKAIRDQIKSAIDVIVQQSRLKDGTRKVTYISELTGMEGDTILMHNVFEFIDEGMDEKGYIKGKLKRADRISTGKK